MDRNREGPDMRGIAFLFVATAALFVTIGMVWGIQMSASGNHMLSGAHAHLNLIGWVTMGLFGFYYHLVPAAAARPLAKVHYGVATLGVLTIVPGALVIWFVRNYIAKGFALGRV